MRPLTFYFKYKLMIPLCQEILACAPGPFPPLAARVPFPPDSCAIISARSSKDEDIPESSGESEVAMKTSLRPAPALALILLILSGAILAGSSPAQLPKETAEQKQARLQWWTDARFGMFIHWGLYAQAARHEWVKKNERITDADYQKYFETFNPDLFNPREWARAAKNAGMKYAVITSKHHEGFCLFDSEYHRLQSPPDSRRPGSDQGMDRGLPGRGTEGRVLLFPARLASSRLHDRPQSSAEPRLRRGI